jgi:hypothetical protein
LNDFQASVRPPDQRAQSLPFGLLAGSIVITSLGLSAAVVGIRWGAAPPHRSDALELAWTYVNVMWMLTWLVVWPAVALARPRSAGPHSRLTTNGLLWDLVTLLVAAIPAVGVATLLSGIHGAMLFRMLSLQVGAGILTMGALACCRRPSGQGIAVGFLAALAAVGPVIVYFWSEFFSLAPRAWTIAVPLMAVATASQEPGASVIWWIAGGYALVGIGLLYLATAIHNPQST